MKSRKVSILFALAGLAFLFGSACSTQTGRQSADLLNPYGDGAPEGTLGQRNANAIMGVEGKGGAAERARHALEVLGSYRQTQEPQPTYPVIEPAEVRLMWVPDHLNKAGDLVPAHYYYLLVRRDRWALQDAFDLEGQLQSSSQGAATPWVPKASNNMRR